MDHHYLIFLYYSQLVNNSFYSLIVFVVWLYKTISWLIPKLVQVLSAILTILMELNWWTR